MERSGSATPSTTLFEPLHTVYADGVNTCFGVSLACALAVLAVAQGSGARIPRFEDYPAKVLDRTPVAPQFVSKEERLAEKEIVFLFKAVERPNFAGQFVVIEWPCGSECTRMVVVDAITGSIYPPPLNNARWAFCLPIAGTDFADPEFRADSRLFILKHGCPEGLDRPCHDFYYVWESNAFKLIRKVPITIRKQLLH